MTELSPSDYRVRLAEEAERLAKIDPERLTCPIPHIEGWTVHSVLGHTGWVLRYVDLCLASDPANPPSRSAVGEPPHGVDVIEWFTDAAAAIDASFTATDLDDLHPTFTGPQPTAWWLRRLSHEVAMHRWDAESASGAPQVIEARQARDGVNEVFQVFVPNRMQFDVLAGAGQTIHLHATDIEDGEWLFTLHPDRIDWEHGHAKGDVAAKGTASDLLLLLWSRLPPNRLQLFGDASLLDRWQISATF